MCNGFGAIVDKDLNLYFIEPDSDGDVSHSGILERLGWADNPNQHLRRFVRVECRDWTIASFRFDENSTLPGWVENNRQEIQDKVGKTVALCAPAWAEYDKVRDAAWAEFEKVCAPAWAEYDKVRAPAWAEFEKVCSPAWAEYEQVCAPAYAEYEQVCAPARAEYVKVCDPAWAEMVERLSRIKGYVPAEKEA